MTLDMLMSAITYTTGVLCGGLAVHAYHVYDRNLVERERIARRKELANLMRQKPKP